MTLVFRFTPLISLSTPSIRMPPVTAAILMLPLCATSGTGGLPVLGTGMANVPVGNPLPLRASGVVGSAGPGGVAVNGEPPGSPTYQVGVLEVEVLVQNTALLMAGLFMTPLTVLAPFPGVVPRAAYR